MAGASTVLQLSEDGGAFTTVATVGSLTPVVLSGSFNDFSFTFFGASTDNSATLTDLLSSTTSVRNNSTGSHTLSLRISSQDFTLPSALTVRVESGMGGSDSGLVTMTFQAYADKNNILAGTADYTNGLQTCVFNVSTCDTGSAAGNFTKTAGVYSLTSVANLTLSGGGTANYSSHVNVTNVPEPDALVLVGTGLLGLAGLFKQKKS